MRHQHRRILHQLIQATEPVRQGDDGAALDRARNPDARLDHRRAKAHTFLPEIEAIGLQATRDEAIRHDICHWSDALHIDTPF